MKHLHAATAAAFLLCTMSLHAQEQTTSGEDAGSVTTCGTATCQANVHVTLKDKNGGTFDRTFKTLPASVQPLGLIVVAGQTLFIEADVVDGKLTNLVSVTKVSEPARTITAAFKQIDGKGMMLTVRNPFAKSLKFNMAIMPLDRDRLVKTSSCPIGAGIISFETWPYPIFQVVLGNGHLLEDGAKIACVE